MDDLVVEVLEVEMRKVEILHRAECLSHHGARVAPVSGAQPASDRSKRPEHARPVETLPLTMLAVLHDAFSISQWRTRCLSERRPHRLAARPTG